VSVAENPPQRINGKISASDEAGLGVTLDRGKLGAPVASFK
jgi:L-alanine-DL-glutamate epimerase-like enolase superfamily enzyme